MARPSYKHLLARRWRSYFALRQSSHPSDRAMRPPMPSPTQPIQNGAPLLATGRSWLVTMCKSTFVLVFVCLLVFDGFLQYVKPLQFISMGGYICADQNPLQGKFEALISHDAPLDLLLLGSSLVLVAAQNADERSGLYKPSTLAVDAASYSKSKYLQTLLTKKLSHNLSVLNFAAPTCMVSDALLVLKNAIARGHKPATVILGLAPRDFIDNQVGEFGHSPFYSFFNSHGNTDDKTQLTFQQQLEDNLERWWHYFQIRADYRILASLATTGYFHRAQDLYTATQANKDAGEFNLAFITPPKSDYGDRAATEQRMSKSLALYQLQYLPINTARYQIEQQKLRELIALCQEKSIRLAIINMPLTRANVEILPRNFKLRYAQDINQICQANGVPYVDLSDDDSFKDEDFYDSVHTNGSGGIKIWERTVAELSNQGKLTNLFTADLLASASPKTASTR